MKPIWTPDPDFVKESNYSQFNQWLSEQKGLDFEDYEALWAWSCDNLETFWNYIIEYYDIELKGDHGPVVSSHEMPGVKWFEGARVNYTRELFKRRSEDHPALITKSERRSTKEISWDELFDKVASSATFLKGQSV